MTLKDFMATMFLMGWNMKFLPKIEGEPKAAIIWNKGEDTVWWSMDMDGKWSFLYTPTTNIDGVMYTYYTFEKMLEILNSKKRTPS